MGGGRALRGSSRHTALKNTPEGRGEGCALSRWGDMNACTMHSFCLYTFGRSVRGSLRALFFGIAMVALIGSYIDFLNAGPSEWSFWDNLGANDSPVPLIAFFIFWLGFVFGILRSFVSSRRRSLILFLLYPPLFWLVIVLLYVLPSGDDGFYPAYSLHESLLDYLKATPLYLLMSLSLFVADCVHRLLERGLIHLWRRARGRALVATPADPARHCKPRPPR